MAGVSPPPDGYRSFARLVQGEREGSDFLRQIVRRESRVAILAPHGGGIEPGSSEIARAIAGSEFSLYTLEGTKSRGNGILHLPSGRFDDPACLEITRCAATVLTVHGASGEALLVQVGGLDESLGAAVIEALRARGFRAERDDSGHSGRDPENICNRGASGMGVQLEISRALRAAMFRDLRAQGRRQPTPVLREFADAVRRPLLLREGSQAG
jgi:phage replication-related protein YjqB (UPF0714/DUF867 family)